MTRIVDNTLIIEPEEDGICEECGDVAETRPYGKNGANICVFCGVKDDEAFAEAKRQYMKRRDGLTSLLTTAKLH